jgi:hypothetical protein
MDFSIHAVAFPMQLTGRRRNPPGKAGDHLCHFCPGREHKEVGVGSAGANIRTGASRATIFLILSLE